MTSRKKNRRGLSSLSDTIRGAANERKPHFFEEKKLDRSVKSRITVTPMKRPADTSAKGYFKPLALRSFFLPLKSLEKRVKPGAQPGVVKRIYRAVIYGERERERERERRERERR